ncbi:MAG: large conductance mechanosensitive channel protein MscL [Nitrospira sp.]|nr:large conductance mechanosensitive channel protein MscL [Nitrospira sp.]
MFKEFKAFVMRGNVLDLAIGIIIGVAFGKIISSLVSDILMPPIGMLMGKVDFSSLFINLTDQPYASLAAAKIAGAPTINYGVFAQTILDFVIVAFVIFLLVRQINAMRQKADAPPATATTKECGYCLSTMPLHATRCAHCASDQKAA